MPSPITHIAAGYAVYLAARKFFPADGLGKFWRVPGLLILTVGLAMLPDMDSVLGVITGNFGRYHNQGSHSFVTGVVVSLIAAIVLYRFQKGSFTVWFFIMLAAYESHVIMDYFTYGRGVMLIWPFSSERFISPLLLFYGLHWSDGLLSINHIWTVITEVGLIMFVYVIVQALQKHPDKNGKNPQINILKKEYADDSARID